MEVSSSFNICRVCLVMSSSVKFKSMFDDNWKIAQKFFEISGIEIFVDANKFEALICGDCLVKLENAYAFREQSRHMEEFVINPQRLAAATSQSTSSFLIKHIDLVRYYPEQSEDESTDDASIVEEWVDEAGIHLEPERAQESENSAAAVEQSQPLKISCPNLKAKRFFCVHCSYASCFKIHLNNHLVKVHNHCQGVECTFEDCEKSLKLGMNLKRQSKLDQLGKETCKACGKRFKNVLTLSTHIAKFH